MPNLNSGTTVPHDVIPEANYDVSSTKRACHLVLYLADNLPNVPVGGSGQCRTNLYRALFYTGYFFHLCNNLPPDRDLLITGQTCRKGKEIPKIYYLEN